MYNNQEAGAAFTQFLTLLGDVVRLKGFESYRAQLDTKSEALGAGGEGAETVLPWCPLSLFVQNLGLRTCLVAKPGCGLEGGPRAVFQGPGTLLPELGPSGLGGTTPPTHSRSQLPGEHPTSLGGQAPGPPGSGFSEHLPATPAGPCAQAIGSLLLRPLLTSVLVLSRHPCPDPLHPGVRLQPVGEGRGATKAEALRPCGSGFGWWHEGVVRLLLEHGGS